MQTAEPLSRPTSLDSFVSELNSAINYPEKYSSEEGQQFVLELANSYLDSLETHDEHPFELCYLLTRLLHLQQEDEWVIRPLPKSVWHSNVTSDRFAKSLMKAAKLRKPVYIVSGSLRHELFNHSDVILGLEHLLLKGSSVTIVTGPKIIGDDEGVNRTANLLKKDHIGDLRLYYSARRWQSHGFFMGYGPGHMEIPHTEVQDIRTAFEISNSQPAIRYIQETMNSLPPSELVEVNRDNFEDAFERHIRRPQDMWKECVLDNAPADYFELPDEAEENLLYLRALSKFKDSGGSISDLKS